MNKIKLNQRHRRAIQKTICTPSMTKEYINLMYQNIIDLLNSKLITKLTIGLRALTIITKNIYFRDMTLFGPYIIKIPKYAALESIRIKNVFLEKCSKKFYAHHMHIAKNGWTCFGDYAQFINEALDKKDYFSLIIHLVALLTYGYNENDSMPILSNKGNPYDVFINQLNKLKLKYKKRWLSVIKNEKYLRRHPIIKITNQRGKKI